MERPFGPAGSTKRCFGSCRCSTARSRCTDATRTPITIPTPGTWASTARCPSTRRSTFRGWLYDISGLSVHRFQFRVLWQLATRAIHAAHAGGVAGGGTAEDDPQRAPLLPHLSGRRRPDRGRLRVAAALVLRAAAPHRRPDHADVQHHPACGDAGELALDHRQHPDVSHEPGWGGSSI